MKSTGIVGDLARRLRAGERLISGWSGISDPIVADLMIRQGYDTVVLDMQHGAHTVASALLGIGAVALAGAGAVVRVPVGEFALASRMLDGGAAAIIAPMVNSLADARAFASFVKYPPMGDRSWGPHRAVALSGANPQTYLAEANATHLSIAMIETKEALAALDDILSVPGIDGVFVGPSDLSIALSGGKLDPASAEVDSALDHVVARAKAAGKFAGLFCFTGKQAKAMGERGFAFCSVATDSLLINAAAKAELAGAR